VFVKNQILLQLKLLREDHNRLIFGCFQVCFYFESTHFNCSWFIATGYWQIFL